MESSDPDTESECFESAEESFDEENELESKSIKSEKSLCKSEKVVAEPVLSNYNETDSADQLEKKISNLSYRKRPEGMRRSLSKPQGNSISKSTSNEIFNAEKIVSDVFFQDITNSLSKNINKSLTTLQQTSCNVKDLILSSIPVSSIKDDEKFSYDDKMGSVSLTESDTQSNCNPEIFLNVGHEEKDFGGKSTFSEAAANSLMASSTDSNHAVVMPTNIKNYNMNPENCNLKASITNDILKQEMNIVNEKVNEEQFDSISSSSDCFSKVPGGESYQNITTMHEETKENSEDSYKTRSNYKNPEISDDQEKTDNEEINNADSVGILKSRNQQNERFDSKEKNCTKTVELLDKKSNLFMGKHEVLATPNKLSHGNNSVFSEITNKSLISKRNNCSYLLEEDNKIHLDCNLEELKMALKNIVKEDINSSEVTKGNAEKKFLKEDCNLEEKVKFNSDSNDGWDDFDFSDDEVKNINQNEKDQNIKKKEKNLSDEQLEKNIKKVTNSKSVSESMEIENQKSTVPVSSPRNLKKSLISEEKSSTKDVENAGLNIKKRNNVMEGCIKNEKSIQPLELKSVTDDSWDWDNWNEIPENEEKVEFRPIENLQSKKSEEEDFFDVSKWSGWDTFGQKPNEKQGNWNLGSWGVDVLLNKATAVTQGISNVIEAGLGAPDPETLIRLEKKEREKFEEHGKEKSEVECEEPFGENSKKSSLTNVSLFPVSGITSLVAGVTSKIVEHSKIQEIGTKVITGGLDTLETFGKKTMEVLQEGDPGLKNKRALLLGNNKPVLSQVLREAREKANNEIKKAEEKEVAKKCHFETLFDDFQGMVHLEALEMLSRQCELKLDQIKSGMNSEEIEDLNGILEEVEQLCSLEEFNINMKSSIVDFKTSLQMAVEPLKNEISIQRIIQILEDVNKWLKTATETKPSNILINQKLVSTLAELTAATVHQFHKSGELLSVKECRKTVEEVDALSRLTNVLCIEINRLGEKFLLLSHNTNHVDNNGKNFNSFNEKVAVVGNNSMLYIRQAFNLLIPVIQLGAAV